MQVDKIRDAVDAAENFTAKSKEVLGQASHASYLLCNGKHAKILKQASTRLMQALTEMRRP